MTDDKTQQTTWRIGPRTLPPPAGASDVLRNSIADTPQPDPVIMQIEPQSETEWFAAIAQFDERKMYQTLASRAERGPPPVPATRADLYPPTDPDNPRETLLPVSDGTSGHAPI